MVVASRVSFNKHLPSQGLCWVPEIKNRTRPCPVESVRASGGKGVLIRTVVGEAQDCGTALRIKKEEEWYPGYPESS